MTSGHPQNYTTLTDATEKFFYDLFDEALDPDISDEVARRILTERFGAAMKRKSELS